MSILSWLMKPKKEMVKPNTKRVCIGKYKISSHAQNRISQPKRDLSKGDMLRNLYGRSTKSKVYKHNDGTSQYDKLNKHNRTITHIVNKTNDVKTIRKYHKKNERKELSKFGGKNNEK